jgi:LuxR family maltose regulon positive regulatory protein
MGEILYEWNELEEAGAHLAQGMERAELGGDVRGRLAAYLLAGRLNLSRGDQEAASGYLEKARALLEGAHFEEWQSRFERLQLELWLAQDRLRAALQWADQAAAHGSGDDAARELALARLLILKGDNSSLQDAAARLRSLQESAEELGRLGVLVEGLALQALAHWQRGDEAAALTSLERALRLAQPEGYMRLFVDLGLPMARLLQEAQTRDMLPETVAALLAAFEEGFVLPGAALDALPEPLTPREEEVLALLAAGLTNREIGEQLVISPQTVKKHAGNIYGKLGAGNRTEAVARARELNLLD